MPALCAAAKAIGDLDAVLERLIEGQLATSQTGRECLPVQLLHDEEIGAVLLPDVEERADVRMREGRNGAGVALEPLPGGRVPGQVRCEHLDRNGPVQTRIASLPHLAHASCAKGEGTRRGRAVCPAVATCAGGLYARGANSARLSS
jgi:hypothetical protein